MVTKTSLNQNRTNTPLGEYYEALNDIPKKQFKSKVISKLGISETTFYRWLAGSQKPCRLEAEAIADMCGIPAPTLYPHHYITQL